MYTKQLYLGLSNLGQFGLNIQRLIFNELHKQECKVETPDDLTPSNFSTIISVMQKFLSTELIGDMITKAQLQQLQINEAFRSSEDIHPLVAQQRFEAELESDERQAHTHDSWDNYFNSDVEAICC
ncbi:hypothetical protein V6259_19375 [Marinomonas sp. TI.3.20]|uniref:hypothetical protein n=1 Tax=Marinomonas sp. TI.3.20 TaxID=3121296 RepID=UPI00311E7E30